jgi:hypothetical protein
MKQQTFVFRKKNYLLMAAGILLMVIGYLLMQGGGSDNPEVFNPEIFAPRRLTWAPLIIVLGIITEIYAIMAASNEQS